MAATNGMIGGSAGSAAVAPPFATVGEQKKTVSFQSSDSDTSDNGKESKWVANQDPEDSSDCGDCRMEVNECPALGDHVVVKIKLDSEAGFYVSLLEYNNLEGLIFLGEYTRSKIRTRRPPARIGAVVAAEVISVEKGSFGYRVDLSKKKLTATESQNAITKYNKSKLVNSILKFVAKASHVSLIILYTNFVWPLKQSAYDLFVNVGLNSEALLPYASVIGAKAFPALQQQISNKFKSKPARIRAMVEVTCFTAAGIDSIKEALRAAKNLATTRVPIRVQVVAAPKYILSTSCIDAKEGLSLLENACAAIKSTIVKLGGAFVAKKKPYVSSKRDEENLEEEMDNAEQENAEIDGDEDATAS